MQKGYSNLQKALLDVCKLHLTHRPGMNTRSLQHGRSTYTG